MAMWRFRDVAAGGVLLAALMMWPGGQAAAHDGSDTGIYGIVSVTDYFYPSGSYDDPYNGYRVYLSSPRHANSGNRGECWNPGRQENENGRGFNWRAANGNFIGSNYSTTNRSRNLHARGYYVAVSPNTKDDGYITNRDASRNWGSNLHIVTHTNALRGCGSTASYLMTMWSSSTDKALASKIGSLTDPAVPGGWNNPQRTDLAELGRNASHGDAYVELQFHDNQSTQSWLYSSAHEAAWRYGYAVDSYLGYP